MRSLMVELKESMKPLESGLGDLLLAHHTLASFVHTDAMPSGESADDESRSLENVDFEKFMGTLPADRLPILRNRVMRLLEAIVAACLAYVRAQLTSIAVEIGGAKLQSGSGNKGGAELVRLRAVERRLLAEKLKRQEDAHLINAIGQHLSADADNAPHGFHELIGMLGSERYGWRLIPRMQAALEGLTVISGELLRRHYALVSKLCDARTIDRRGVTLRPIAELLRAKLYSAAVERASKELEQPSASAAAPAAAKPPAASAPKEKKGSADDKKARKAEAKKLAAAEAARAAAEAAAAELAARDAARKAAAEETERRMAEALAARAAELRQKQADEDAAALEQMQRANAAQQMRAQAQRASEAAAAAEAERVARAEAEAREAEDREQAQRAEAERAAAAAVAADAAALNSRGSVTPAPPVIIQLPTPLPPWEAQPPLPLPPFSPPPPPLAAPARVEDRVAGLESQLAQMTAAMAALQAQLASSALEAAHQQNRAAAGPSTLVEASLCVICDDALRDRLLMPCCHLALCGGCVALHSPKMCPICRAPVASFLTVLHP